MNRTWSAILALFLLPSLAFARSHHRSRHVDPSTLAVLKLSADKADRDLADAAADALNAELTARHTFIMVERRRIAQVAREQALGQSGFISEASAAKVGQIAGARMLVIGRLSHLGEVFRIDVRLLDSNTAQILAAPYAEFRGRDNLDLAVREVADGLVAAFSGIKPTKSAGVEQSPPKPIISLDPARLHDAAAEVVKQIGARFLPVHGKLTSVDEAGFASFSPAGAFVFPGMRFDVYGVDDMTGGRAKKGVMMLKNADSGQAAGPTESESSPIAQGDDVESLPFQATVTGPTQTMVDTFSTVLRSLTDFTTANDQDGTPMKVVLDLKGATIGERHLVARVIDPTGTVQASCESNVGL